MVRLERLVMQGFKSFKRKVSIPFPEGFSVVTGPNGSGKCVTGDTLVQLADGSLSPIGSLVEQKIIENTTATIDDGYVAAGDGTAVLSLDFETLEIVSHPVSAFVKRTSPPILVRLRTCSGREITSTPEHPFFIRKGEMMRSIPAGELTIGIGVAVPFDSGIMSCRSVRDRSVGIKCAQVLWDDIASIERIPAREEWVYDLSIDRHHNYVANNFFVHNSNVGDGIAFVLGEKSSRSMRAKKAQDLIFHGSDKKEGSDFAFVALYFDNTKHQLPFDDPSVSVSRKLNKNGVSTYRLNGKVVTRQQVVDVLSQAQISPDGHNIIQQGDVTQIVEMDSVQRRQILDELSGILEFDEKKQKALKELEKISIKVKEAEIILNEKTAIMAKLSSEREAALKYRTLQTQLEQIRAAVLWKEYAESDTGLAETTREIEAKSAEMEHTEAQVKDVESKVAETEKRFEDLTKEVVKASASLSDSRKQAQLRAEVDANQRLLQSHQTELRRLDGLIDRLNQLDRRTSPAVRAALQMDGVHGMLIDLLQIPQKYHTAVEVALGSKASDLVVSSQSQAVQAVQQLKAQKVGRARFLPLDKIRIPDKRPLPKGSLGWLSDLVSTKPQFLPAIQYALGSTALASDIQSAKSLFNIQRTRLVTMDGDLLESSGAITGGFYSPRRSVSAELNEYRQSRIQLADDIDVLESRTAEAEKQLSALSKADTTDFSRLDRHRADLDRQLTAHRQDRTELYQKRLTLQAEIGRLNIKRARFEAKFDNVKLLWQDVSQRLPKPDLGSYETIEVPALHRKERDTVIAIESLGPINMKAVDDYDLLKGEFDDFRQKVDAIVSEKNAIEATITKIEEKRKATFMETLTGVNDHFRTVYNELTGGAAELALENDTLDSGLMIRASPPGKKLLNLDSMSGGEKTLTAFAFLFALQRHRPTPFYVLDEADAALDKQNTSRVAKLIHKQSSSAQFIIISHNDSLIKEADRVYGVSMEDGESKVIGVELPPEQDIKEQQMIAAE